MGASFGAAAPSARARFSPPSVALRIRHHRLDESERQQWRLIEP